MKTLKYDLILIGGILLVSFILWLFPILLRTGSEGTVKVMRNGLLIGEYPLTQDDTITIPSEDGYNLLFIRDGKASITDADCPDKLCVRQHDISRNGESIICLPHKLVIQIESKEESELDAVTY